MEYSPGNAIPFISRVDAGIMEVVTQSTGAEILSSADVAQLALAVLTPQQWWPVTARSRRVSWRPKMRPFELIAERLRSGQGVMEHEVQSYIVEQFAAAGLEPMPPIVSVNANAADPHYFPSVKTACPHSGGGCGTDRPLVARSRPVPTPPWPT